VLVGVKNAEDVQRGFDTIVANAKKYNAKANILGVQVQQMLAGGQEVIIGAVTDPVFGKLVAFGLGGVLVEVLKDITFRLSPATREDALSMLDGIAAAQILKGVRGADPVNRDALAKMIQNVSQLISDHPEIAEMDLNPVFATKDGAIAADVRIVVNFSPAPARFRPKHEDIVRDMNRIMKPKAVAVIGASSEAGKIGNSVMKNLINGGYKGQIYPINPSADEIMGLKAYKSVRMFLATSMLPSSRSRRSSWRQRWQSAARRRFPAPSSFRRVLPRPATSRARRNSSRSPRSTASA
jgi:acyl-CoA synthetase (NDP forming)